MADNNTASAGFLTPIGDPILYDDELVDLVRPTFVGISGIAGDKFFPRWQAKDVPNQPEYNELWAALGVARLRKDTFQYEEHTPDGAGFNFVQTTEEHDFLLSVYGPRAQQYAFRISRAILLDQNRAAFQALNMDVVSCGDPIPLPALLHGIWQRRVDMTITLRRCVEERYGVLTIVGLPNPAEGDASEMGIDNEEYITPIIVEGPT